MFKTIFKSVVPVCLALCVAQCANAADRKVQDQKQDKTRKQDKRKVKIWDTGKKHQRLYYHFRGFQERREGITTWTQVPYGKTGQPFKGDLMIENDFFYLCFHTPTGMLLYVKRPDGGLTWVNAMGQWYYPGKAEPGESKITCRGIKYIKILKNTPKEVVLERQSSNYPGTTICRIMGDKRWLEVSPVSKISMQRIHGKVRIGLAPVEGGNDYVVDSLRDPRGAYEPTQGKMVLAFYHRSSPFMWVMSYRSIKRARPYFNNDSGPTGDTMWWGGEPGCPRKSGGCVTSTNVLFGGGKDSVIIGALNNWNNWHRDDVDKPIKKGEVYTSKWKPPYPGRWRMTVRIAEKRYDQGFNYDGKTKFPARHFSKDVYDGNFTFNIPIDGHLDYVLMYMYDRTKETPKDVQTPMDQYRWTIRKKK